MGDGDYKVVFDHISLFVRKVRVNPGVLIGHAKALEKATAKYPIDRAVCKVFSIPQSSYSFIQDNIFSGQIPKRLVLVCKDNDAFNGNYKKSPFEFNHYYMNFLGVYVDGQPMRHQPLELDFQKDNYIRAYQNLFLQSEGLYLSRTEFPKGYALYLFDLSPDIHRILSRDRDASRYFIEVFPSDEIPLPKERATLVVNTDTRDQEGSHWFAMYIKDKNALEFFYSYGFPPEMYGIHTYFEVC
ncbi:uncharacterized protein F54H12.2 [Trichonephila clavipes]|nr:uncharacterized protein F54H12.2 [Trichonephila clavipes]